MDTTAPGTLAVELYPHSPTHWVATYYPMVSTPAGRWADVTWVLHQALMPVVHRPLSAARWLEATSPDPGHSCYDNHPVCAPALAAGYTTARLAQLVDTAGTDPGLTPTQVRQLQEATVVVPPGQLAEWLLEDLQDAQP